MTLKQFVAWIVLLLVGPVGAVLFGLTGVAGPVAFLMAVGFNFIFWAGLWAFDEVLG